MISSTLLTVTLHGATSFGTGVMAEAALKVVDDVGMGSRTNKTIVKMPSTIILLPMQA